MVDHESSLLHNAREGLTRAFGGRCLKHAEGDITLLKSIVSIATSDYRDVLAYEEYPNYMSAHLAEPREAAEPKKKAMRKDWEQLQEWLNRK